MCNYNDDIKRLNNLRAKGHVLIKGYKILSMARDGTASIRSSCFPHFNWEKGWNYARTPSGNKMIRTKPYPKNTQVNHSIHVYKTRPRYIGLYDIVQPVWYYADEVTSYDSCHIITVSKVLIKTLKDK